MYYGRGDQILKERERLKKISIVNRRKEYQKFKNSTNKEKHLSLK